MTSTVRIILILGLGTISSGASAIESYKIASRERPSMQSDAPAAGQVDNPVQAICREVFVDTDEGYGVTNQEARVVCDQLR
jgi:hypothetical protein